LNAYIHKRTKPRQRRLPTFFSFYGRPLAVRPQQQQLDALQRRQQLHPPPPPPPPLLSLLNSAAALVPPSAYLLLLLLHFSCSPFGWGTLLRLTPAVAAAAYHHHHLRWSPSPSSPIEVVRSCHCCCRGLFFHEAPSTAAAAAAASSLRTDAPHSFARPAQYARSLYLSPNNDFAAVQPVER
jgi:hypothetical protein